MPLRSRWASCTSSGRSKTAPCADGALGDNVAVRLLVSRPAGIGWRYSTTSKGSNAMALRLLLSASLFAAAESSSRQRNLTRALEQVTVPGRGRRVAS